MNWSETVSIPYFLNCELIELKTRYVYTSFCPRLRLLKIVTFGQKSIDNPYFISAILDTHEGCDIIVVDWRRFAGSNYTQASARVRDVAIDLTRFLQWLIFSSELPYEGHFHLVGFDLGAHIAGLAGRYLQTGEVRIQVGRITGKF